MKQREIKFRAWDKRNKIMENGETWMAVEFCGELISTHFNSGGKRLDKNQYIIQQYTGLKDKNGKEIYEGDIVFNDVLKQKHIVEFNDGGFRLNSREPIMEGECNNFNMMVREIIGNIYENPELLKK